MALSLTVRRGAGDNPSPEQITLEYFTSEAFARQIGAAAIDQSTTGMKTVSGVLMGPHPFVRPGAIIRHRDMRKGECRGMVEDFSFQISQDKDGKPNASVGITFRRMEQRS